MLIAVVTIVAIILSAILYRLGGMSQQEAQKYPPWKWFPSWAVNTKARDAGCSAISMAWFGILFDFPAGTNLWFVALAYLVGFAGTWAALTTYWDGLFGYDNFYMHGFMIGFAKILFAVFSGMWLGWLIQCVISAILMGLVSAFSTNDYVEECGRGASMPISQLPMLFI